MPKKDDLIDSDSGSEKKNNSDSEGGSDAEEEEYVVEEIRDKRMKGGKVRFKKFIVVVYMFYILYSKCEPSDRISAQVEGLR